MSADADLEELHAAPLSSFLDVRKTLAQRARKAGDKSHAAALAALPKPTPAAWAVNQIARRNAADMAALIELGSELRHVMRAGLSGDESSKPRLARLASEQHEMIALLLTIARSMLEADGVKASDAVLDRIKTTLMTISTTGGWGDGLAGRLTKELEPPSVDTLAALLLDGAEARSPAKPAAPAIPAPKALPVPRSLADERAVRAAREALARAEDTARDAALALERAQHEAATSRATYDSCVERERAAGESVRALEAQIARARAELESASRATLAATDAVASAEAAQQQAALLSEQATREQATAKDRVEALRPSPK